MSNHLKHPHSLLGACEVASSFGLVEPLSPEVGQVARYKDRDLAAIIHAASHPTADVAKRLLRTRQAYAMITKNPCLQGADPTERRSAAVNKFFKTLAMNRITTKRLKHYFRHPSRMPREVAAVLGAAKMELFRLLGPTPSERDWENFVDAKVFSKGTVQGISNAGRFVDVDPYAKLSACQTFTGSKRCLQRFGHILINGRFATQLHSYLRKGVLKVEEREFSEATCVFKDAGTDRFIAIEALLNAMAQQGIRSMFDPYLRSWGITLHDQAGNIKLAKYASTLGFTPGGFATVDLSSASDTIIIELVKYLMPKGWFELLSDARSSTVRYEGTEYETTSFSTMGNAFTFPLQCLIFSSLVKACINASHCDDKRWKVYGDDIIVPLSASMLLVETLRFAGFTPNMTKSFYTGFFRESCGGDYLGGYNVRPVYLKDDVDKLDVKHQFFNALQLRMPEHPVLPYLYETVKRPLIGPAIGPQGGETSHFVAPVWLLRKRRMAVWNKNTQSYLYRYAAYTPKSRKRLRKVDKLRYICGLVGSYGRCHDIRGSQRFSIEVKCTTTPWIAPCLAPFWYII